ncbi:MAG: acyltransferase family protein [Bacteroidales bacterium]|nr:acyltransferase family protein [Bacteroidales bacterium]
MAICGHTPGTAAKAFDPKIDIAKGLLIILVVLGHSLEPCGSIPSKYIIHNIIYLFHMPAFIAISGYLTHLKDNNKFWKSQLMLIETYFVFQALHYLPHMGFDEHNLRNFFVLSERTMWYLPCLIIWRTVVQYLHKAIKDNPLSAFLLSIAFSLMVGFVPVSRFLNIQRLFAFLPFFIGGYLYKDCLRKIWSSKNIRITIFGLSAVLIPFFMLTSEGFNDVFTCSKPYFRAGGLQYGMALRLSFFICATSLTAIVISLAEKITTNKWLIQLGRSSLLIYMTHYFLIIVAGHFFKDSTLAAIGISIVIITGMYFLGKYDTSIILNPVSTAWKKIKK